MLSRAWAVAAKDLRLSLAGGQGPVQAILLGLLLIFVFSLSQPAGSRVGPQAAAAVFWLATSFGLVLIFNTLYSQEERNGARQGLLLAPCPVQAVWLGKAVAGLVVLLLTQAVFAPAVIVFLNQDPAGSPWLALGALLAVDWGLVVHGALLGALSQGQASRESLLTVILFPLLVPVLLSGIRVWTLALGGGTEDVSGWMGLALAFDGLFTGAALVLYPFVFSGEE